MCALARFRTASAASANTRGTTKKPLNDHQTRMPAPSIDPRHRSGLTESGYDEFWNFDDFYIVYLRWLLCPHTAAVRSFACPERRGRTLASSWTPFPGRRFYTPLDRSGLDAFPPQFPFTTNIHRFYPPLSAFINLYTSTVSNWLNWWEDETDFSVHIVEFCLFVWFFWMFIFFNLDRIVVNSSFFV